MLRQCHDLENPRGPAPVVGPLVHERTAIQIIVDNAKARRRPADGARRRTLEELEITGYHTLCGQARKQRSRYALPLSQCECERDVGTFDV